MVKPPNQYTQIQIWNSVITAGLIANRDGTVLSQRGRIRSRPKFRHSICSARARLTPATGRILILKGPISRPLCVNKVAI